MPEVDTTMSPDEFNSNVGNILDSEYNNSIAKNNAVNNSLHMYRRSVELNSSFQKRYSKYTQIIIALIVAILGYLCIMSLAKALPFIPSLVIDIITIILFLACIIYAIYIYMEILSRSEINYDELNIPTVLDLSNNPLTPATFKKEYDEGDLYAFLRTIDYAKNNPTECVGAECCSDGYVYDPVSNKCVSSSPEPTALPSVAPSLSPSLSPSFSPRLALNASPSLALNPSSSFAPSLSPSLSPGGTPTTSGFTTISEGFITNIMSNQFSNDSTIRAYNSNAIHLGSLV